MVGDGVTLPRMKRFLITALSTIVLAVGFIFATVGAAEASPRGGWSQSAGRWCGWHPAHYWRGQWIKGHYHAACNTSRYHARRSYSSHSGGVWDRIAACESGGDWHNADTGHNGHYGGLQFSPESWRAAGGKGMPHHASKAEQIHRAEILLRQQGWGAWTCAHRR